MNKALLLTLIAMMLVVVHVHGQEGRLFIKAYHKAPADFLNELSLQSNVNIIYNNDLVEQLPPITLEMKAVTVDEVLNEILKGSQIKYRYVSGQIILFHDIPADEKFSVGGLVTDSISGEPLISAYVYDELSGKSTFTNDYGYFSLFLPAGDIRLLSGYSGFSQQRRSIQLNGNKIIHFKLAPNATLPVFTVRDTRLLRDEGIIQPVETLTLRDLQNDIQIGGSSDLYRAADFIPGIHTGTDGVGGFHVRGGGNDQNLILMDGVPVYHPSHLLGIVSVFNYQVLQQASVYKANFPSRFSGRLSSVIDVRTREGNINDWGFSGNVGVSEVGLLAEGPIVPGKVGILMTGRFFLPGLFMEDLTKSFKRRDGIEGYSDIDYVDFNGKINWIMGSRDRFYLSMYQGSDRFTDFTSINLTNINPDTQVGVITKEEYDKNLNWANRTGVFRWNHIVSDKMFSNFILSTSSYTLQSLDKSTSDYRFIGTSQAPSTGFDTKEFKSGIRDITTKLELDIRPTDDHQLNAGIYAIHYNFQPKSISHNELSKVGDFYLEEGLLDDDLFTGFKINALEAGIYGEDKWEIVEGLNLSSGLHVSGFFVQKTYYLDPQLRMNIEYQPKPEFAFNAGYSRMTQYLHLLTSSSIGLPTDLWVPTTAKVAPSLSDQYSVSALWVPGTNFSIDFSAYLKDMRSLISYQEGASFLLKEGPLAASIVDAGNWEAKITEGDGESAGVELQFTYQSEKVRLNLNGAWARSYRRFDDVNFGEPYPDRYDRRWSSTFTGHFKFSPKWSGSVNFIYGSGIAITLAESVYYIPGSIYPVVAINYPQRNGYRLPPYHRLDATINYHMAQDKRFNHSLSLNLFNIYNRTNPFNITLVKNPTTGRLESRQFSLFRFFPTLTYRFAFQ